MGASPPPERVASPAAVPHPALEAAGSMRAFCRKRRGRWASGSGRLSSVGKEFPPQKVPSLHPPPTPPQDSSAFPVCWLGAWLGEGRGALGHPVSGVPAHSHWDLAWCHSPSPAWSRTWDRTAWHLASPRWSPGGGSLLRQMIMEMVSQLHRTWRLHTRCPTREKQFSEMKSHHHPLQPALCGEVRSTFNENGLVCW